MEYLNLVELKHRADIKAAKFDGYYTYFAANGFTYGSTWKNWKSLAGKILRLQGYKGIRQWPMK